MDWIGLDWVGKYGPMPNSDISNGSQSWLTLSSHFFVVGFQGDPCRQEIGLCMGREPRKMLRHRRELPRQWHLRHTAWWRVG